MDNDEQRDYAEEAYNKELRDNPDPPLKCLDDHKGDCHGRVENRMSLTGTGMPIPRCDKHWDDRLEWDAEHREIYPDSPIAPSWFDPTACGERWDDDY